MKRILYLIPAGDRAAANTFAKASFDPVAGEHSFRYGVSPTGDLPATHYIASGLVADEKETQLATMKLGFANAKIIEWDLEKDPTKPGDLLTELGLQRIVTAL